MALYVIQRQPPHEVRPVSGHGDLPPQRMCLHPAHNGIPVPTKYTGTSVIDGVVIHHLRCVLNSTHHRQFARIDHRWQEVKTQ